MNNTNLTRLQIIILRKLYDGWKLTSYYPIRQANVYIAEKNGKIVSMTVNPRIIQELIRKKLIINTSERAVYLELSPEPCK